MRAGAEKGFSTLEVLIIIVVVCAVVAIGVPRLHRGADAAVLDANLQSLGATVNSEVSEGYSPEYKASGEGDPRIYISSALEETLTDGFSTTYTNPFVGREKGTQVVNSPALALESGFIAPAVLITDWSDCQYFSFAQMSPNLRRLLAGALIVSFNPLAKTIDVYFVDQHGRGSIAVVSVPTGSVRTGRHG
jgi:hypothetical protein